MIEVKTQVWHDVNEGTFRYGALQSLFKKCSPVKIKGGIDIINRRS
jgi:hypothetical protein